MATTTIITEEIVAAPHAGAAHLPGHYLSWGAIVAGAICAAAISVVLFAFGSAIGLSAISPWPHSGLPPIALAIIGALWMALVQVVAFASGGYVAGRVRNSWGSVVPHERRFRDGMHGFVVWALGLLLGSVFAVSAAGGLLRTGAQATAVLAAGATGGAMSRPGTSVAYTPADYAIDYLLRPASSTADSAASPATGAPVPMLARIASPTELRPSLDRIFVDSLQAGTMPARERSYLASLVAARTGLSPQESEKRVDEAFQEARTAEVKARAAADKARKVSALAAFLAAATLAIGCAAACAGAGMGGRHRDEQTDIQLFGTKRFW